MPPGLLKSVDIVGDRLVSKAAQLVQNKTTNLSENFMSVRCKMDGGKYFNRVQSGSFQHRCMAAPLRIQHGPGWLADVWKLAFSSVGDVLVKFSNNRKRQHTTDTARKIKDKYKKQRLMSKSGPCNQDTSYGQAPAQPDISPDELQHLCIEYIQRLKVTESQQQGIALRTVQQADDPSGEWFRERIGRLTASTFGHICKRKSKLDVLTKQLLYCKPRETKEMRYGRYHEVEAREQYLDWLKKKKHTDATVIITGLHVDLEVMRNFCAYMNIRISLLQRYLGLLHLLMA